MECVELAPAFEPRHTSDSGSKLHALHTLRETRPPVSSVCAICSVSPGNLRKKTRFSPILFSAPGSVWPCRGALRIPQGGTPYPPSLIDYEHTKLNTGHPKLNARHSTLDTLMRNTLETRLGIFVALAVIALVLILETVGGVERFRR